MVKKKQKKKNSIFKLRPDGKGFTSLHMYGFGTLKAEMWAPVTVEMRWDLVFEVLWLD